MVMDSAVAGFNIDKKLPVGLEHLKHLYQRNVLIIASVMKKGVSEASHAYIVVTHALTL